MNANTDDGKYWPVSVTTDDHLNPTCNIMKLPWRSPELVLGIFPESQVPKLPSNVIHCLILQLIKFFQRIKVILVFGFSFWIIKLSNEDLFSFGLCFLSFSFRSLLNQWFCDNKCSGLVCLFAYPVDFLPLFKFQLIYFQFSIRLVQVHSWHVVGFYDGWNLVLQVDIKI